MSAIDRILRDVGRMKDANGQAFSEEFIDDARAELDALRADSGRLEWVVRHEVRVTSMHAVNEDGESELVGYQFEYDEGEHCDNDFRAAIDGAKGEGA